MRSPLPLLLLALVALPACDAVESVIDSLSQPTQEELDTLSNLFGCEVLGISSNGSRTGSLAGGDCRLPVDDSLVDLYAFRVTSETTVRVTMTSDDLDPYLLLFTSNSTEPIRQQPAEGDTAALTYRVNSGVFVIGANTATAGQTGTYTVGVERQD